MRMKLNKSSQLLLASAASLLAAGLLSACSTLTTDFVYVTSAKASGTNNYGEINIYEINSDSGHMRQIPASPMYSEGRNPVAEAVSPDYSSLFVVNQDDNTVVQFTVGTDGKLYPINTVNTPGIYPLGIAVGSSNAFVLDTYQPLVTCTSSSPCSGSIGVFALSSNQMKTATANGSKTYWPLCATGYTLSGSTYSCKATESDVIVPTGIALSKSGTVLYVSAYDSTKTAGYLFSYTVGTSGALTPVSVTAVSNGGKLSSIAVDTTGTYVYATDYTNAKVHAFTSNAGVLTALGSYTAGNGASSIALNPAYGYAYVANAVDSNVIVYTVSNGTLTPLSVGAYASGLEPVAIGVDPSKNQFVFTANFLGSTVSGWKMNTSDGSLMVSQGSPFSSNTNPTAVAAVPHK
jgi:6-phosphogluconolactonase